MKIYNRFLLSASIVLVMATSASSLSEDCEEEILDLLEEYDFDMKAVIEDLVPVAVKVKLQAKAPLQFLLGPGSDDKMTEIGVSVGCLKEFPESAGAATSMLKSIGLKFAKSTAANKLGATKKGVGNTKSGSQSSQKNEVAKSKKAEIKDIIYLLNGQEIKNATIFEISSDEVKYKVGTRAIAYAAKKTEISAIRYADGEKDFFCSGVLYNATVHFCHTDGKTYSCGNQPYNPAKQSCSGNTIHDECAGKPYSPVTHFCHTDGQTYSCNDWPYNPATHFCHTDGQTYSCDGEPYDPETESCE